MTGKKHPAPFLIVAILLISPVATQAQKPQTDARQDWWFNIPTSPLVIQAESSEGGSHNERRQYGYGLKNVSSKAIRSYALGCVKNEEARVRFFVRAYYPKGRVLPGQVIAGGQVTPGLTVAELVSDRGCQGGRVAVTDVFFEDGTRWEGKHLPWEEAKRDGQ